jgi:hypothetical protein
MIEETTTTISNNSGENKIFGCLLVSFALRPAFLFLIYWPTWHRVRCIHWQESSNHARRHLVKSIVSAVGNVLMLINALVRVCLLQLPWSY